MDLLILILCTASIALGKPGRIIGGENAEENQFPYQIFLAMTDGFGEYSCGGSILDNTTILTAAHCVQGYQLSGFIVYAGNNELNKQNESYAVERAICHENYNEYTITDNIAILKLKSPMKFHKAVQPIALRKSYIGKNEKVVLSGWGSLNKYSACQYHLQFIHLTTFDMEGCAKRLAWIDLPLTDKQLCTFTTLGEGGCNEDSGGPLVDSKGQLVGILSWGEIRAFGYPDVYTRVYSYLEWIEKNRH